MLYQNVTLAAHSNRSYISMLVPKSEHLHSLDIFDFIIDQTTSHDADLTRRSVGDYQALKTFISYGRVFRPFRHRMWHIMHEESAARVVIVFALFQVFLLADPVLKAALSGAYGPAVLKRSRCCLPGARIMRL
jgi:hypothetical protein